MEVSVSELFKVFVSEIIPSAAKIENECGIYFIWSPGINPDNFESNNFNRSNCISVSYTPGNKDAMYWFRVHTNERGFLETEENSYGYDEFWELAQSLRISFFMSKVEDEDFPF